MVDFINVNICPIRLITTNCITLQTYLKLIHDKLALDKSKESHNFTNVCNKGLRASSSQYEIVVMFMH